MKNVLSIISILIFLTNCAQKSGSLEDFTEVKKLEGKELTNLAQGISHAYNLISLEGYLLISDQNPDNLFKLASLSGDSIILSFGKVGDGPCEFQFPSTIQRIQKEKGELGIFNRKNFSFSLVNFDSLLQGKAPCIEITPSFNINYQKVVKLTPSSYIGFGLFDKKYAITDTVDFSNPRKVFGAPHHSEFHKNESPYNVGMAYQGDMLLRPSGGYVLNTSRYSANFDILSFNDSSAQIETRKEYWPTLFEGGEGNMISATLKSENNLGFLDASVTDKYIYLLYSGSPKSNGLTSSIVLVYDWKGEAIMKYILDRPVALISVTEDDYQLIAYYDDGSSNFIRYTL